MKKQSYIAIAAARSGGHIIPGMTLAYEYCSVHDNTKILFFSTAHNFDQKIITQHAEQIEHIPLTIDNVPSRWYRYPRFVAQGIRSFCKSFYYLAKYRPSHVILMGGYVSIPVCLAAMLVRIPRKLYELNATPGSATKLLAPLATNIHVCFESAQLHFTKKKTVLSTYPLRFTQPLLSRHDIHTQLALETTRKTVLILGGSQGSVGLNKILFNSLQNNATLSSKINIIHQTGAQDTTPWAQLYTDANIPHIVFDYHHDLSIYYQAADLIIARAGAGTIFETLFFSKPCILIPLEIAGNDHQLHNAQSIAQQHPTAFTVIRQQETIAEPALLAQTIEKLL